MRFRYKIFEQHAFIIETFHGNITAADLNNLYAHQIQNPLFASVELILSDTRKAKLNLSPQDLIRYIGELKQLLSIKPLRWAIIDDNPTNAAFSHLLKNDSFFKNRVEVFSTFEAAAVFLAIPYSEEVLTESEFVLVN